MAKSVKNGLIEAVAPEEIIDTPIEEVAPVVEDVVEDTPEEVVVEEAPAYVAPPVPEESVGYPSRDFNTPIN